MIILWSTTDSPYHNTYRKIDRSHNETSADHVRNTERMAENADQTIDRYFINFAVGFAEADTPLRRDL